MSPRPQGSRLLGRSLALVGILVVLVAVAGPISADDVFLTNGSVFEGVVAEVGDRHVSIELPIGRIKLPKSQIERVVEAASPMEIFRERRSALLADPDSSVDRWLELAEYADVNELERDARETALLVARLAPLTEGLDGLLGGYGYVRDDSLGWVPLARSMARQGFVRHRGQWLRPEDRQAQIDLEREELALERERQAVRDKTAATSSDDVALEAVKLARDVVRDSNQSNRGRNVGQVVGFGGFYPGPPAVIPALPLSGSFEQEVAAAEPQPSAVARPARVQYDWDVIANRQPGSVISLRDQRRQVSPR